MSEWSLSLGWSAADQIPDSDGEDNDDDPLLEQVSRLRSFRVFLAGKR